MKGEFKTHLAKGDADMLIKSDVSRLSHLPWKSIRKQIAISKPRLLRCTLNDVTHTWRVIQLRHRGCMKLFLVS